MVLQKNVFVEGVLPSVLCAASRTTRWRSIARHIESRARIEETDAHLAA